MALIVATATAAYVASVPIAARPLPAAEARTTPSSCPALTPPRLRIPARFFPLERAGAWVPTEARDCLYLINPGSSRLVAIFRAPNDARIRGPVWSPDGQRLAIAYKSGSGFKAVVLSRHGRIQRAYLGRDVSFLRDGRAIIGRADRLLLADGPGAPRPLVDRVGLEAAAGFKINAFQIFSISGYGRPGLAITAWGREYSRILIVSSEGTVASASPRLSVAAQMSFPGPPAWSPDGELLLIPWQRPDPLGKADHVHCLSRWGLKRGYRLGFCRNPHFDRVVWHPDGGTALLNDGRVVARDATVRARVPRLSRGWSVRWTQ